MRVLVGGGYVPLMAAQATLRYTVWPSSRRNCSRQDATRLQLHQRLVDLVGYVVLRVAEAVSFKLHINGDKLTGRFEGKGFRNGND